METPRATSSDGAADRGTDAPMRSDGEPAGTYWTQPNGGPGPQVMAADTLIGDDVRNRANEKLGEIVDIMIDVPTGRVAYAVMSVGGVLGVGAKLFAIPWSALLLDTQAKCFRLNVAKERFDVAPGFDRDHWPAMADQSWAEDTHRFYGARPYWV
jgi:hypothetical protein